MRLTLNIDFDKINVIPAQKDNEDHKKGILKVFNENIKYFHLTKEPVSYEDHSKWWAQAFIDEFIYVIIYEKEITGYIRLTKYKKETKEENEISIAISEKFQKSGFGTHAYQLFESEMKKIGINKIIAITERDNVLGQRFFEKNKFKKILYRYVKII